MTMVNADALHDVDQDRTDAAWERTQERALRAYRDGNPSAAIKGWDQAFEIAKQHFIWGDPRLATSLTNKAFVLIRQEQFHQAKLMLDEAVRCWQDSWRWVPFMQPLPDDDQRDETRYDDDVQQEFYAFIKQGQEISENLASERRLPAGSLEAWKEHRPPTMCDVRKLISAVFLIASTSPDGR